jgi:hypothetical protein
VAIAQPRIGRWVKRTASAEGAAPLEAVLALLQPHAELIFRRVQREVVRLPADAHDGSLVAHSQADRLAGEDWRQERSRAAVDFVAKRWALTRVRKGRKKHICVKTRKGRRAAFELVHRYVLVHPNALPAFLVVLWMKPGLIAA